MIAPAAPPMAASRLVFLTVSVRGAEVVVPALLLPEELLRLLPDDARRVVLLVVVRRGVLLAVVAFAGAAATGAGAGAAAAAVRSAALMESMRAVFACAARPRSALSEGSAGLSLLHAAASTSAGARMIVLMEVRMKPPWEIGRGRKSGRI
jgi:hypothetical protein